MPKKKLQRARKLMVEAERASNHAYETYRQMVVYGVTVDDVAPVDEARSDYDKTRENYLDALDTLNALTDTE